MELKPENSDIENIIYKLRIMVNNIDYLVKEKIVHITGLYEAHRKQCMEGEGCFCNFMIFQDHKGNYMAKKKEEIEFYRQ